MTSQTKYQQKKISPFFKLLLKGTALSVGVAIALPTLSLRAQTGTNNPVNQPTNLVPLVPPNKPSPNGFPTYQINPNNSNPNVSPSLSNPTTPNPNGFPTYEVNPNLSPESVNKPKPINPNGFPTYQINPNNPLNSTNEGSNP